MSFQRWNSRFARLRRSPKGTVLQVKHSIELDDVSFHYSADGPEVISGITLRIERGARIGFIGKTGSGKSTLADLIMGLLEPTRGEIRIDGQRLTADNLRRWQAAIAHVPQAIYLADATIAENIAFGRDPQSIDRRRVRERGGTGGDSDVREVTAGTIRRHGRRARS